MKAVAKQACLSLNRSDAVIVSLRKKPGFLLYQYTLFRRKRKAWEVNRKVRLPGSHEPGSLSSRFIPAQKKSMWGDWQKTGVEMAEKWRKSALLPEKS
jgi:hypothetical protein